MPGQGRAGVGVVMVVLKQILRVALKKRSEKERGKTFSNADFIAMNLRSNGKSMCFLQPDDFMLVLFAISCDKCRISSATSTMSLDSLIN